MTRGQRIEAIVIGILVVVSTAVAIAGLLGLA